MMGEKSTGGWQEWVGTRMSFSLDFDGDDGSMLWVHRGGLMMRERSMEGRWEEVKGNSEV